MQQGEDSDIKTLTIFKSQVEEIMKDKTFNLSLNNEEIENDIIQNLPQKIGFTIRPKKDSTGINSIHSHVHVQFSLVETICFP